MKPAINWKAVDAAQVAVASHTQILGIEGDDDIRLWHLIASLIEWCDARDVDFDATVSGVREHFREVSNAG